MQSKMNLSFSIFLMLMLTQVAFSAPVDKNGAKAQSGDPESNNQKLSDLLKELTEAAKKFEEEFKNLAKGELSGMKAKVEDMMKQINSPENKKKIQDFLNDVNGKSPEEVLEKYGEKLNNLVRQGSIRVEAKINELINQINSPETKKKLQDILDKISKEKEKMAEEMKKFIEKELPAIQAKVEDFVKQINSGEAQKKLQALYDELKGLTPEEILKKMAEILKNLPKPGSPAGGKN